MTKYCKKPVVVEAVQFDGFEWVDGGREAMFDLSFSPPDWITEATAKAVHDEGAIDNDGESLFIHTLEGELEARPGDWIIRGIQGELYPCKPDIFALTYELVRGQPR